MPPAQFVSYFITISSATLEIYFIPYQRMYFHLCLKVYLHTVTFNTCQCRICRCYDKEWLSFQALLIHLFFEETSQCVFCVQGVCLGWTLRVCNVLWCGIADHQHVDYEIDSFTVLDRICWIYKSTKMKCRFIRLIVWYIYYNTVYHNNIEVYVGLWTQEDSFWILQDAGF